MAPDAVGVAGRAGQLRFLSPGYGQQVPGTPAELVDQVEVDAVLRDLHDSELLDRGPDRVQQPGRRAVAVGVKIDHGNRVRHVPSGYVRYLSTTRQQPRAAPCPISASSGHPGTD